MSDPNDTTGRDPREASAPAIPGGGDAPVDGAGAGSTGATSTSPRGHTLATDATDATETMEARAAPSAPSLPPAPPPPNDDPGRDDDDDELGRDDDGYGYGRDDDSRGTRSRKAPEERSQRRSGFESMLRDSFRKAVERGLEVGMGTLKSADHVVHKVADEVKMPKEISNYLFSQIDETKNVLIRAVAGEVREFLDTTDLATELQRALTALSFEVRMEIRFIPNEAGELKPKVKTKAVPRARRADRPEKGRGSRGGRDSDGDPDSDDGT